MGLNRREAAKLLAVAPVAAAFRWAPESVREAAALAREALAGPPAQPKFFTAHEWRTVRVLVDLIIPADEQSGSATQAGVPEFIDFMCVDDKNLQIPVRGGLAWLDLASREAFGKAFAEGTAADQTGMLDRIAWPKRAKPEDLQGSAFFSSFRDLTASGFFSSRMGVHDLKYIGNTFVSEWKGCPPEALAKLGVRYS
ncbi:MAG TPA: gluconate 2-dehydrogenase subunit 3 family protein [Gemmatimonadales bacterium]|nr:gluconate 2-dehydrogenase subunit 3 family protein [Gemmatimonadales bacterium]